MKEKIKDFLYGLGGIGFIVLIIKRSEKGIQKLRKRLN